MQNVAENYFRIKLWVLMHDPPNKAWLIINKLNHVDEAKRIYEEIFRGTVFGGGVPDLSHSKVVKSDRLASSFDRWVFLKPATSNYVYRRLMLVNIFNPRHKYEGITPDYNAIENEVNEYVKDLKEDISRLVRNYGNDPRALYNFFYAAYESYWAARGLPPSPADTRAPTHDVFDHVYASAMISNWVDDYGRLVGGYYVIGDIPGVQHFIASSRRSGDLWASSWALSMAVWLTLWPLIWRFGPDILIRPTARLNPLYYAFLVTALSLSDADRCDSCAVFKKLIHVLNKSERLDEGLEAILNRLMGAISAFLVGTSKEVNRLELLSDALQVAFIGESFQLILPRHAPEGVELTKDYIINELRSNFTKALDCVVNESFEFLKADKQESMEVNERQSKSNYEFVIKLLERLRDENLIKLQLPLRIGVLSVGPNSNDDVKVDNVPCPLSDDLLKKLGINDGECREMLLFDYLMVSNDVKRKLRDEEGRRLPMAGSWFDRDGSPLINLIKYTRGGSWIPSTLNPDAPAVVKFGKVIDLNGNLCYDPDTSRDLIQILNLSNVVNQLPKVSNQPVICALSVDQWLKILGPGQGDLAMKIATLASTFKPGEALSPTDLAKRVIYMGLRNVFKLGFESTEDVAARYLYSIRDLLSGVFNTGNCGQVLYYINKEPPRDIEDVCVGETCGNPEAIRKLTEDCLDQALSNVNLVRDVYGKLVNESIVDDVCGAINDGEAKVVCMTNIVGRFLMFHFTYAIVRGDGDSIGDIHNGILPNYFNELRNLYTNMLNDKGNVDGDVKEFSDDINKQIDLLKEIEQSPYFTVIKNGKKLQRIPVSPAYKFAITRSLTVTSLKALYAAMSMNAMPIYMGGDDVAALAPIEAALKLVGSARRIYWGLDGDVAFFHRAGQYVVPALAAYGQSYSIRFTHILDIFSTEYVEAGEVLEKHAKETKWASFNKDSMVVSSSRTSGVSVLPIRPIDGRTIRGIEDLRRVMSYLYSGLLSTTTPNDFERFKDAYDKAKEQGKAGLTEDIVRHVIGNNTRLDLVIDDLTSRMVDGLRTYGYDYASNLINVINILRRLP